MGTGGVAAVSVIARVLPVCCPCE